MLDSEPLWYHAPGMKNDDVFKFCYDEYKRSLCTVDDMYRRYPFALTAIAVLGGALATLSRDGLWQHFLIRVDVSAYYLGLATAFGSLVLAVFYLAHSVWPKDYQEIDSAKHFLEWSDSYRQLLKAKGYTDEQVEEAVIKSLGESLCQRLSEAVTVNFLVAKRRTRSFNRCIYCLTVALTALGVVILSAWVLKMRGV